MSEHEPSNEPTTPSSPAQEDGAQEQVASHDTEKAQYEAGIRENIGVVDQLVTTPEARSLLAAMDTAAFDAFIKTRQGEHYAKALWGNPDTVRMIWALYGERGGNNQNPAVDDLLHFLRRENLPALEALWRLQLYLKADADVSTVLITPLITMDSAVGKNIDYTTLLKSDRLDALVKEASERVAVIKSRYYSFASYEEKDLLQIVLADEISTAFTSPADSILSVDDVLPEYRENLRILNADLAVYFQRISQDSSDVLAQDLRASMEQWSWADFSGFPTRTSQLSFAPSTADTDNSEGLSYSVSGVAVTYVGWVQRIGMFPGDTSAKVVLDRGDLQLQIDEHHGRPRRNSLSVTPRLSPDLQALLGHRESSDPGVHQLEQLYTSPEEPKNQLLSAQSRLFELAQTAGLPEAQDISQSPAEIRLDWYSELYENLLTYYSSQEQGADLISGLPDPQSFEHLWKSTLAWIASTETKKTRDELRSKHQKELSEVLSDSLRNAQESLRLLDQMGVDLLPKETFPRLLSMIATLPGESLLTSIDFSRPITPAQWKVLSVLMCRLVHEQDPELARSLFEGIDLWSGRFSLGHDARRERFTAAFHEPFRFSGDTLRNVLEQVHASAR